MKFGLKEASLLTFFISLALLVLFNAYYKPASVHPEDLNSSYVGKRIIITGAVTYSKPGNTTFIKVDGFPVVFFRNMSAEKGEIISILGTIKRYHGKLEMVGERIIR